MIWSFLKIINAWSISLIALGIRMKREESGLKHSFSSKIELFTSGTWVSLLLIYSDDNIALRFVYIIVWTFGWTLMSPLPWCEKSLVRSAFEILLEEPNVYMYFMSFWSYLEIFGNKLNIVFLIQVDVNGDNAAPLYKHLKSSKGGLFGDSIKWNFSKFLVDKEGNVVERYAPTTSPLSIEVVLECLCC